MNQLQLFHPRPGRVTNLSLRRTSGNLPPRIFPLFHLIAICKNQNIEKRCLSLRRKCAGDFRYWCYLVAAGSIPPTRENLAAHKRIWKVFFDEGVDYNGPLRSMHSRTLPHIYFIHTRTPRRIQNTYCPLSFIHDCEKESFQGAESEHVAWKYSLRTD